MIRVFNEELREFTNLCLYQPSNSWNATNGVNSGSTLNVILTGDGTALNPGMNFAQTAAVIGHLYYVRVRAKVDNAVCDSMQLTYGGVSFTFATSPVENTVYDVSTIITATSTSDVMYMYQYYVNSSTANGKVMTAYNAIIIDLTAEFGSGSEWTQAQMDKIKPLWSLTQGFSDSLTRTLCVNDFDTNGEKVIQPTSCIEILEDNVDWRVELTADLSYLPWLVQDYIMVVPTKENGEQPFRINNVNVDTREVSFTARHIGYDLNNYITSFVFGYTYPTGIAYHIDHVIRDSLPLNQFYTQTENWTSGSITFKGSTLLDNVYEIVAKLGGHITFDWWKINIDQTIGTDNGVTIEYGKNLLGAEVTEDWNKVCTQIYPIGNNKLTLGTATNMLEASGVSYDRPYTRKVQFQTDDVVELEELADAYLELNKVPKLNYKVSAVITNDWSNTYGGLEDFTYSELSLFTYDELTKGKEMAYRLGDIIQVRARTFVILTNILGYRFNVLTQRTINVEFGNFRKDVRTVFANIQAEIEELKKQIIQENITMNARIDALP